MWGSSSCSSLLSETSSEDTQRRTKKPSLLRNSTNTTSYKHTHKNQNKKSGFAQQDSNSDCSSVSRYFSDDSISDSEKLRLEECAGLDWRGRPRKNKKSRSPPKQHSGSRSGGNAHHPQRQQPGPSPSKNDSRRGNFNDSSSGGNRTKSDSAQRAVVACPTIRSYRSQSSDSSFSPSSSPRFATPSSKRRRSQKQPRDRYSTGDYSSTSCQSPRKCRRQERRRERHTSPDSSSSQDRELNTRLQSEAHRIRQRLSTLKPRSELGDTSVSTLNSSIIDAAVLSNPQQNNAWIEKTVAEVIEAEAKRKEETEHRRSSQTKEGALKEKVSQCLTAPRRTQHSASGAELFEGYDICEGIINRLKMTAGASILLETTVVTKNASQRRFVDVCGTKCIPFAEVCRKFYLKTYDSRVLFLLELLHSLQMTSSFYARDHSKFPKLCSSFKFAIQSLGGAFGMAYIHSLLEQNRERKVARTPSKSFKKSSNKGISTTSPAEVIVISSSEDSCEDISAPPGEVPGKSISMDLPHRSLSKGCSKSPSQTEDRNNKSAGSACLNLAEDDDLSSNSDEVRVVDAPQMTTPIPLPMVPSELTQAKGGKPKDELEVVGVKNEQSFPHARCHCTTFVFKDSKDKMSACSQCFCFVCDVPVTSCKEWRFHCTAVDTGSQKLKWLQLRQKTKSTRESSLFQKRKDYPCQYQNWPATILIAECRARNIASTGQKQELVTRLKHSDTSSIHNLGKVLQPHPTTSKFAQQTSKV